MRRIAGLILVVSALMLTCAVVPKARGSQSRTARDLYTSYDGGQQGRPGVKVSVRLRRDGQERRASVDEQFYNGDRIKLALETNFTGYVAVINVGPTGKKRLLYPEEDDAVFPASGATLPPADDKWIVFDDNAGEEKVVLIFSAGPLGLSAQRPDPPAAPPVGSSQSPAPGLADGMANGQDAQSILSELNTRAINRGRDRAVSRDMFTETLGSETYTVASQAALSDPVGVEFTLRHGRR
ncbi:MAG TPA: DUF4384 domain-containing protein [Pyrinomonadaceae bacterium]